MLLFAVVLTMADPTHVYDVTWDKRMTEAEVRAAVGHDPGGGKKPLHVVLAQFHDSQRRRWKVAVQSADTRFRVRDRIKDTPGVKTVRIVE